MNIFEQASRRKLRFDVSNGIVGTEDLWDLPLTSKSGNDLDTLAVALDKKLGTDTKSFVKDRSAVNETLQLKFDVVKHVIDTKLAEARAAEEDAARKARKQKLLEVLEKKADSALDSMSVEDIKKELALL